MYIKSKRIKIVKVQDKNKKLFYYNCLSSIFINVIIN